MRTIAALLLLTGCAHEKREGPIVKEPWSAIDIADGSANAYHFTRGADGRVAFEYDPVRPEESSTGTYSGGPPRREALDAGDPRLSELWGMLQRLKADPSKQQAQRDKGTAAIGWREPGGARHAFIVVMGPDVDALVALLARFGQ